MPTRSERLIVMANEINGQRYPTVDHFCREFEVQPRTVYEDIRILKESMGLDVKYDRFNNGYFNANPAKKLPAFELTDGELFALLLGKEMLSQYTGTAFEQPLRTAIEKISQRLPERVQIDFNQLSSMVSFHPGEYKLRNERFRPPMDLDIDVWLKSAFQLEHGDDLQIVRVRFGVRASRYIRERKWHASQKLTEFKDGTCILEFETRNLEEVKRWVLAYGAEAEVQKPERLREMLAKELKEAAKRYGSPAAVKGSPAMSLIR